MLVVDDVQELIEKLLGQAKARELGIRELKVWLESKEFIALLDRQSLDDTVSWPGILQALIDCVDIVIKEHCVKQSKATKKTSKRRPPNAEFARVIKRFISQACVWGKKLSLLPAMDSYYCHAVNVFRNAPWFEVEYATVICRLASVPEYWASMRKKIFTELVELLSAKIACKDAFLSLVKHPPRDVPDKLRPVIVSSLAKMLEQWSDRNQLRKIMEAVTGYLVHDGPNLGEYLCEIHVGARKCLDQHWPKTVYKDVCLSYLTMQLRLRRIVTDDEDGNLDRLLQMIHTELDGSSWDLKTSPLLLLLQLSADVIYEMLARSARPLEYKRRKKEDIAVVLKSRIEEGKLLWMGMLCVLLGNYGDQLPRVLVSELLEICVTRLERGGNEAVSSACDTLLWTIRCLHEASKSNVPLASSVVWQAVWDAVSGRTLLFCGSLMDDALHLLAGLAMKKLVTRAGLPADFWHLRPFKEPPTRSGLLFVTAYFSAYGCQVDDVELRGTLLRWCLTLLDSEATRKLDKSSVKAWSSAVLSLCLGSGPQRKLQDDVLSLATSAIIMELNAMNQSERFLTGYVFGHNSDESGIKPKQDQDNVIGLSESKALLHMLSEMLSPSRPDLQIVHSRSLTFLLSVCTFLCACLRGVAASQQNRGQGLKTWSGKERICETLRLTIEQCAGLLQHVRDVTDIRTQLSEDSLEAVRSLVDEADSDQKHLLEQLLEAIFQLCDNAVEDTSQVEVHPENNDEELDASEQVPFKHWKSIPVRMIACIGEALPQRSLGALKDMLLKEEEPKLRQEILLHMCHIYDPLTCFGELSFLSAKIKEWVENGVLTDREYCQLLKACRFVISKLSKGRVAQSEAALPMEIVMKLAECKHLLWKARSELGNVIADCVVVEPEGVLSNRFMELLNDPDFRVRLSQCHHTPVLFRLWSGHRELLADVYTNLGVRFPCAFGGDVVTGAEACQQVKDSCMDNRTTTAMLTLGAIAAASEDVEAEVIFMVLAQAAIQPSKRSLAAAIMDRVADKLGYPDRWKYLDHVRKGVLHRWVVAEMPLPALVEMKDVLAGNMDAERFLQDSANFLAPCLLFHDRAADLQQLVNAQHSAPLSVEQIVIENFASTLAALVALHCDHEKLDIRKFLSLVEGPLLRLLGMSEDEGDNLIKKHMVSIVGHLLLLVRASPDRPYITKAAFLTSVKTLVDDIFGSSPAADSSSFAIKDKMQMFRSDRVFEFLLLIHQQASTAINFRHRRHSLSQIVCLVTVIDAKVAVPSTFRYLLHILLQFVPVIELQNLCCELIACIVDKLENSGSNSITWILGEQLPAILSKLVYSSVAQGDSQLASPLLMNLLRRFTVEADESLHYYLKEVDPFPDIPQFEPIRRLQSQIRCRSTFSDDFVKFVRRAPFLSSQQRFWSLRSFCNHLRELKRSQGEESWLGSDEVVVAIWELVLLCNEDGDYDIRNLTGEFLAAAGIADPDAVVFQLPDLSDDAVTSHPKANCCVSLDASANLPEAVVQAILVQLCGFLVDDDSSVIRETSQAAKGLLSTSIGQAAFKRLTIQERAYLEVFKKGARSSQQLLNDNSEQLSIGDPTIWSTTGKSYHAWICNLVSSLIRCASDPYLKLCEGLVKLKASLAELLLPHVFGLLAGKLRTGSKLYGVIVSQIKANIFCESNGNTRSIQVFLDVLNALRVCHVNCKSMATKKQQAKSLQGPLSWPKVYWLDMDYLLTARAAQNCAAYFTSLLYVEHWCEDKFGRSVLGDVQNYDTSQLHEHLELLLNVYTKVNEPDGVYGIVHEYKPVSQLKLYEHEGGWSNALETYDLLLKNPASTKVRNTYEIGVLKTLHQVGCFQVNEKLSAGLAMDNLDLLRDPEFRELQYESAWKVGKWDFSLSNLNRDKLKVEECLNAGFHEKLHRSFKYLMEGDSRNFHASVEKMQADAVSHVVHTSLECTQNVNPAILKLQIADSLSQAWDIRWPSCFTGPVVPSDSQMLFFHTQWVETFKKSRGDYNALEPLCNFLRVIFQVLKREDLVSELLLEQAMFARKAGRLSHATLAIHELKSLSAKSTDMLRAGRVEEAKVLWSQGQQEMALNLLKLLLSQLDDAADSSDLYCLVGKWLARTRAASSRVVMECWFEKAVQKADSFSDMNPLLVKKSKAHFHLARFADSLYKNHDDLLRSNEWVTAKTLRELKKKELIVLRQRVEEARTKKDKRELPNFQLKMLEVQRQIKLDEDEESRLEADKRHFLKASLENYRSCLLQSSKYDISAVFSLLSLWFRLSSDAEVVQDMRTSSQEIQSYKFLPLVYQIASRMGASRSPEDFPSAVCFLVKKMALEHPYHTLYQVFALANGDRVKKNQKNKNAFVYDMDKKQTAEEIIAHVATRHPQLIAQMKLMVEVYINLAEMEVAKDVKTVQYSRDIRKVRQLEMVPVITANVAIDTSCRYIDCFPHFKGFQEHIQIMNGVNAPKVVQCLGSDGRIYRQLAKSGDDDLRQDAVMEQLFSLVNTLLKGHADTRKRRLQVRTYKVIPFTPSAGALEWVDGTMTLGHYLIGEQGAHERYRPQDWPFSKCRAFMAEEVNKSAAFQKVCENFRPVMRFFFRERFKQAAEWFGKRLTYTRSVAASSMVGYIIGLGDRHAVNILIDQKSAEVVHIDLGVAFEQGLMLMTPEKVPFRLTRDIVDGMGVSGVEGVFRRCSEATLSVMRANKEALLTIIEVFLHDPLYKWALSPLKALQRQKEMEELEELPDVKDVEGNKDAARVLRRVKQKLDGYEWGEMRTVRGQVQQLLQDAQDPERLALMFPGWAAWV